MLLGKLIFSQIVENVAVQYRIYENVPPVSAKSISKILCSFISATLGVYSLPLYYLVKVQIIMLTSMYFFSVFSSAFCSQPPSVNIVSPKSEDRISHLCTTAFSLMVIFWLLRAALNGKRG